MVIDLEFFYLWLIIKEHILHLLQRIRSLVFVSTQGLSKFDYLIFSFPHRFDKDLLKSVKGRLFNFLMSVALDLMGEFYSEEEHQDETIGKVILGFYNWLISAKKELSDIFEKEKKCLRNLFVSFRSLSKSNLYLSRNIFY